MTRYRLEWRDVADVGEQSGFCLFRCLARPAEVIAAAGSLAKAGSVCGNEFHVVLLDDRGMVLARVLTDASLVAAWLPGAAALPPAAAPTLWETDDDRTATATYSFEQIRDSVRAAHRSGAISVRDAVRLVGEARTLLDPIEDPDEK